MSAKVANRLVWAAVVLQFISVGQHWYNDDKIDEALASAVSQGRDRFDVSLAFSFANQNLTMANGWKTNDGKGCSVHLVRTATGTAIDDSSGLILDTNAPPRRYVIKDCSKLPPSIYKAYTP